MDINKTFIEGLIVLEPKIFEDHRGNFYESYSQKSIQNCDLSFNFVQDNESYNKQKGTIRGIHLQIGQMAQAKLIRVTHGSIYGVGVDLRKNSPTYKKYFSIVLSSENHKQILIPRGCGWGFQTLEDDTTVCYKLDNFYSSEHERGVIYNDPELNIPWPIQDNIIISDKDLKQKKVENLINTILVTGASGQLAYDVQKALNKTNYHVISASKEELNICHYDEVIEYVSRYNPDVIINCAAYTNVDKAETENQDLCYDINVNGTRNLLEASRKVDAKFVYISSDYVFDGTKKDLYDDRDLSIPKNHYGLTKLLGEEVTRSYHKHFIIRTSWLFGIGGNNFVKSMLNLAKRQDEVSVVDDQIGSPTYTVDLANTIVKMIETNYYGSYNVTNSGYCSWNEFAQYIFNTFNLNMKVKKISTIDYQKKTGGKVNRPLNSKLDKKALKKYFAPLPDWQDALLRFKVELETKEKSEID